MFESRYNLKRGNSVFMSVNPETEWTHFKGNRNALELSLRGKTKGLLGKLNGCQVTCL